MFHHHTAVVFVSTTRIEFTSEMAKYFLVVYSGMAYPKWPGGHGPLHVLGLASVKAYYIGTGP